MITLAIDLVLVFAVLFWLALGVWVYRDAGRRISNPWLVALATGAGLFPPFLGPLVYMLFRPPEYLDERRERELEIRAMEARLRREHKCPVCRTEIDDAWIVCPVCTTKLRHA